MCTYKRVYLRAAGNLSLINHLKRMAGDGIRPLDMMIKALSMKQEPHRLQLWEMSARHSMILYISTKITTRNTVPMAAYMPFSEVL